MKTPPKMIYPELFHELEKARWNMASDIPWDKFDAKRLTDEQAMTIKMNAITEWSALPATEMFLRDNQDDSDFSAFMSIWFFEEQKHSLVLIDYLRRFRPDLVPTEEELHAVRFPFDPAPALETLMLHFCGEIRLMQWYRRASQWHTIASGGSRRRNAASMFPAPGPDRTENAPRAAQLPSVLNRDESGADNRSAPANVFVPRKTRST